MQKLDSPRNASSTDITFVMLLARALHQFGTPSHQLEGTLLQVTESLELQCQILATPTAIQAAFGAGGSQMRLERCDPGQTDLEKLTSLQQVIRQVIDGNLAPADATEMVRDILDRPSRYSNIVTIAAFAVCSGMAALLFGGGWREMLVSTVIGGGIGALDWAMAARERAVMIFPAVAAFFATVVSRCLAIPFDPCVAFLCSLSGLIILVPGLTLTVAVNELANRHLVSGTSRLTGALVLFLEIALGVALGSQLCDAILPNVATAQPVALPWPAVWLSLIPSAAAFLVLFRARPRDYFAILAASFVAFASAKLSGHWFGAEVGPAIGAFALGATSNLLARTTAQPASITLVPGLLMLVPGSFGFKSLAALIENDVQSGIGIAFAMALTAVSLVTGLLVANLVIEPRRVLY